MGSRPILSQVVTKVVVGKTKKDKIKEQDQIIEYISTMSDPETFQYIITRPSDLIRDRPSRKKLAASKSVRSKLSCAICSTSNLAKPVPSDSHQSNLVLSRLPILI